MKRVKDDFNKRKSEINRYFDFLEKLDKDRPRISFEEMGIHYTSPIDAELLKILKANGFLLIYNLVESFCRNFILEILTTVQGKNLTLKKLSQETQKLWIAQRVRDFKDPNTSTGKLEDCFYDMANSIINNTVIEFSTVINKIQNDERYDVFGLSGNIDKRKIQSLAKLYGFQSITPDAKEKAGADLEQIKIYRNKLAHGRITFTDCGKDKSVTQMVGYKNNAIEYLEEVLSNIENYITAKSFKA